MWILPIAVDSNRVRVRLQFGQLTTHYSAMNALLGLLPAKIGGLISPKPQDFPTEHYDGWEYRYGKVTFRPAMFKTEGIILGAMVLYYLISFIGTSLNAKKVAAW